MSGLVDPVSLTHTIFKMLMSCVKLFCRNENHKTAEVEQKNVSQEHLQYSENPQLRIKTFKNQQPKIWGF